MTFDRTWAAAVMLAALCSAGGAAQAEGTTVSHAITTFGDPPKYPADFPHLSYVNPDAPKGGEISIWWMGTFDTMNPYSDKGNPALLASSGFETMLTGTADEIGASYCLLCETMEYPADKAWVTFTLREGITFSDGSPMTADDVVFSYEQFRDGALLSFRTVLQQFVQQAEVTGPLSVRYTFKPDSPARERIQMAGGLPVMSKAWFVKTGAKLDESRLDPGLGSGPYRLGSYDIGRRIVYERNPDYWGRDLPINRGRSNFDRIRVEYFADPTAAFEGFKAGNYTFRSENSSKNWATSYEFPALDKGWVVRTELPNGNITNSQAFIFNLRRDKFKDPRVREALGLMFNFEWSNKTLFYGLYARTNSWWENSDLAATGKATPEELALLEPLRDKVPPEVFTDDVWLAPVSKDTQLDRRNAARAGDLLDAAGWGAGADGVRRNAKGETLSVEFLSDDPNFERVINPFVENLKKIGVDAILTRVDDAQYEQRTGPDRQDKTKGFEFDVITQTIPASQEPGTELKQYLGSEGADDLFNKMGLADPGVDALIVNVAKAESRATLRTATHALDRVLRANRLRIPQWYKDSYWVAYYDMYEHPDPLPPFDLGYLDFWWYNAEKGEALKAAGAFQ
ncbi:MAG: extracellular solute-binding protein [Paracoccaceae bacterium]